MERLDDSLVLLKCEKNKGIDQSAKDMCTRVDVRSF